MTSILLVLASNTNLHHYPHSEAIEVTTRGQSWRLTLLIT